MACRGGSCGTEYQSKSYSIDDKMQGPATINYKPKGSDGASELGEWYRSMMTNTKGNYGPQNTGQTSDNIAKLTAKALSNGGRFNYKNNIARYG